MFSVKTNIIGLLGALVLLLYAAVLITNNYRSQVDLQHASMTRMTQMLERQALTLGYFFSEQVNDLKNLAQSRVISAYFENQALGMSLEYGLGLSLENISGKFAAFKEEKQVGSQSIYSHLALTDEKGALLAGDPPCGQNAPGYWQKFQTPDRQGRFFFEDVGQGSLKIIISVPCFLKGEYKGQIVACLSPQIPYEYFLTARKGDNDSIIVLCSDSDHLYVAPDTPLWALSFVAQNFDKMEFGSFQIFPVTDKEGDRQEILGTKISVPGTPFSLVPILPPASLANSNSPTHLLFAMGLFTFVVLFTTVILWRAYNKNFILQTRIEETDRRKREVEETNLKLQQEISDRKKAEAARQYLEENLRRAQKMEAVGTLTGGIAHEFNNILAAIIGFTELALLDLPDDTPAKEDLLVVLKSSLRGKSLIQQLLAFSRQEKHELIPVEINPIIKEVMKLVRGSMPSSVEIRQDIALEPMIIIADHTQIQQVLLNLCANAAQAMAEKGTLQVCLRPVSLGTEEVARISQDLAPGDYALLEVRDNGCGMDSSTMEKIFDPFFTTKDIGRGTGLGLSVVLGIIQNHGGAITVESELGRGTVFYLYFPVVEGWAGSPEAQPDDREDLPHGHERILLVDDEPAIAGYLKINLERLGYVVRVKTDSREALVAFRSQPGQYDLMITDQTMPGLTGSELAREALRIRPDLPVIMCTGFSSIISEEKATEIGIRSYLVKPVDSKKLARLVRTLLDEK